jgi:hypothetical protein
MQIDEMVFPFCPALYKLEMIEEQSIEREVELETWACRIPGAL